MNVEDVINVLSKIQYKQSLDWYVYLMIVISSGIGVFLNSYFKEKGKNYATKDDFEKLQSQLCKNTELVESIKGKFNEKYWVKQKIWDTKRQAYEDILNCLFMMEKYVDLEIEYLKNYTDCFIHIGHSYDFEDEEYQKSYEDYVAGEQKEFKKRYESQEVITERQNLSKNTRDSLKKLESVFTIKSIYLSSSLQEIESLLGDLRHSLYEAQPTQDYDHGEGDVEYFDRVIGHHLKIGELVKDIIVLTKDSAIKDLKLSA